MRDPALYDVAILAIAGEASKKFNPNQPRVPKGNSDGGQWTDGTAGGTGKVVPLDKQALRDAQRGKTFDELYDHAKENQNALGEVGRKVEGDLGVSFIDPGVKGYKTAFDKIAREGYEGPHELVDLSRASFVVDTPDQADAIIDRLSGVSTVHDGGWKLDDVSNYHDRKVYLQFPNGGASEIQIVHRTTAGVKGYAGMPTPKGVPHGAGHKLYEIARTKPEGHPVRERAFKASRRMYARAIAGSAFAGLYSNMGDVSGAPIPGL